jgi:hypothetical protein
MKPTVQKMLAYTNLCSTSAERQRDAKSRQDTVKFYQKLRGINKELARRAFLAACDHNDNVGRMFVSGKFYPGAIIGEGKLYDWTDIRERQS